MKRPFHYYKQQGIAVISAMLFVALTTVIVGQLVLQQQLLISELENQQNATQAMIIADASVQWSRAILAEDANSTELDHNKEVWATKLPKTPVEGGTITGQIIDAQQFLNLNNLASEESARAGFDRLLNSLNLKPNINAAIVDWIDNDDTTNGADGAESMYYSNEEPPYLAANQMMTEVGNLIRVKGIDTTIIDKITPFTIALPKNTPVNVNTASAEVLSFILPEVSLQDAQAIVAARNVAYFNNLDDFSVRIPNKNIALGNINLSVNSRYFLVTCIAQFERTTLKIESLLYRDNNGWPIVLWKRVG